MAETTPATSEFLTLDANEIPAGKASPDADRMAEYDTAIRKLEAGKSIGRKVTGEQTPRGAALLFSRAATRVYGKDQKEVECGTFKNAAGDTIAYARRKAAKATEAK